MVLPVEILKRFGCRIFNFNNSSNAADKEGTGRLGGRVVERLSLGIVKLRATG